MVLLGIVKLNPNGKSLRATIPKKAANKLKLTFGDYICFCEGADGSITIQKNGVHK